MDEEKGNYLGLKGYWLYVVSEVVSVTINKKHIKLPFVSDRDFKHLVGYLEINALEYQLYHKNISTIKT